MKRNFLLAGSVLQSRRTHGRPCNSISSSSYYYCGGTWYQPAYSGTSVTCTVVTAPY